MQKLPLQSKTLSAKTAIAEQDNKCKNCECHRVHKNNTKLKRKKVPECENSVEKVPSKNGSSFTKAKDGD